MSRRRQLGLKWALSIGVVLLSVGGALALVATKEEPPRADKRRAYAERGTDREPRAAADAFHQQRGRDGHGHIADEHQ